MELDKLLPVATFIGYIVFGVMSAARAGNKSVTSAGATGPLDMTVTPDLLREILSQHREDILSLRRELTEARAELSKLQDKVHQLERTKDNQTTRIVELEDQRDGLLADIAAKNKRIAELESEVSSLKLRPAL